MIKLKKGLSGLRAETLAAKAQVLVEQMTGNVFFPTPVPELTAIAAATNELLALIALAKSGDKTEIATRNASAFGFTV